MALGAVVDVGDVQKGDGALHQHVAQPHPPTPWPASAVVVEVDDGPLGPFPAHWRGLDASGQVPVLVIDQTPIGDSTAIVGRLRALAPHGLNRGFSAAVEGEALLLE